MSAPLRGGLRRWNRPPRRTILILRRTIAHGGAGCYREPVSARTEAARSVPRRAAERSSGNDVHEAEKPRRLLSGEDRHRERYECKRRQALLWRADFGADLVQAGIFSLGIRWDQPSLRIAWPPEPLCRKWVRVAYMIRLPRNG